MRIIAGKFKGRQLKAPGNLPVRPTTNFAKESIFNIMNNRFDLEGMKVLDLFSGTGNVSVEFISRGAALVVAVDNHYNCVRFLKETAAKLDIQNLQVIKADVFRFLTSPSGQFDIIYADPPYEMEEIETIPSLVFSGNFLREGGWLILEHGARKDFSEHPHFLQQRKYGHVNFSIFQR